MNRKGESGEMVDEKRSRRTEDQDEGVQQTEQDYEEVEWQNETELQLKNKTLLLNYNNLNREFKKKVASEVDMQITINENFKMQLTWKKNSCRLFRVQFLSPSKLSDAIRLFLLSMGVLFLTSLKN